MGYQVQKHMRACVCTHTVDLLRRGAHFVNVKLPQLEPLACCQRKPRAHCLERAHGVKRVCTCATLHTSQAINSLA
jgi:hypothetical protein